MLGRQACAGHCPLGTAQTNDSQWFQARKEADSPLSNSNACGEGSGEAAGGKRG